MKKFSIIIRKTIQDSSYLAKFLLKKNYQAYKVVRNVKLENLAFVKKEG